MFSSSYDVSVLVFHLSGGWGWGEGEGVLTCGTQPIDRVTRRLGSQTFVSSCSFSSVSVSSSMGMGSVFVGMGMGTVSLNVDFPK